MMVDNMTLKFEVMIITDFILYKKHGLHHRNNGPSIVFLNGSMHWHQKGRLHRTDGPAVIYNTGTKLWYHNGETYDPEI
jgi:hypothetical protein